CAGPSPTGARHPTGLGGGQSTVLELVMAELLGQTGIESAYRRLRTTIAARLHPVGRVSGGCRHVRPLPALPGGADLFCAGSESWQASCSLSALPQALPPPADREDGQPRWSPAMRA